MKKSKTIIFIHGIGSSKHTHILLETFLTNNGYHVISFDLLGHGDRVESDCKTLTFSIIIKDTIKFIKDKVKTKSFIIFCHSMGGAITQAIFPTFSKQIQKIIFEDPLSEALQLANKEDKYKKFFEDKIMSLIVLKSIKNDLFENKMNRKEYTQQEKKTIVRMSIGFVNEALQHLFWDLGTTSSYTKMNNGLKKIKCPTYIIFGSKDKIIPCYATIEYFMCYVKNIKYFIFNGLSHSPHKEEPTFFNEKVLEFLKD